MKKQAKARVDLAVLLAFDNVGMVKELFRAKTWSAPPMRAVTGLTIETPRGPVNVPHDGTRWVVRRADDTFDVLDFAALQDEVRP